MRKKQDQLNNHIICFCTKDIPFEKDFINMKLVAYLLKKVKTQTKSIGHQQADARFLKIHLCKSMATLGNYVVIRLELKYYLSSGLCNAFKNKHLKTEMSCDKHCLK